MQVESWSVSFETFSPVVDHVMPPASDLSLTSTKNVTHTTDD